jgi:hypothetical protein
MIVALLLRGSMFGARSFSIGRVVGYTENCSVTGIGEVGWIGNGNSAYGEAVRQPSWVTCYPAANSFPMRLLFFKSTRSPSFDDRIREHRLPSQLSGLASVKTLDGQAVSGSTSFIFYSQTERLSEGFGF